MDGPTTATARTPSTRTLALGLWGVVGALLTYGVVMTVLKATALFTG